MRALQIARTELLSTMAKKITTPVPSFQLLSFLKRGPGFFFYAEKKLQFAQYYSIKSTTFRGNNKLIVNKTMIISKTVVFSKYL